VSYIDVSLNTHIVPKNVNLLNVGFLEISAFHFFAISTFCPTKKYVSDTKIISVQGVINQSLLSVRMLVPKFSVRFYSGIHKFKQLSGRYVRCH